MAHPIYPSREKRSMGNQRKSRARGMRRENRAWRVIRSVCGKLKDREAHKPLTPQILIG